MHTVTHVPSVMTPCRWEVSQEVIVACNRAIGRRISAVMVLTGLSARPVGANIKCVSSAEPPQNLVSQLLNLEQCRA